MMQAASLGLAALLAVSAPSPAPAEEPAAAQSLSFDNTFASESLWQSSGDDFVTAGKPFGFRWVSNAHGAAETTKKGITLFGQPVTQVLMRVQEGKVGEVTVLYYSRGDNGPMEKDPFEALIQKTQAAISQATGVEGVDRGRDRSNAVKAEGMIWDCETASYLLEYSFTRNAAEYGAFRAEFVRLTITPPQKKKSIMEEVAEARKAAKPFRGEDHIKRDTASGDVVLTGIPMVDQGRKGYCVVASAERVLRYYGVRVDANELAQLANSSASEGTSVEAMTASLKKLAGRFKIHVRSRIDYDYNTFLSVIRDYNWAAKKEKAPQIVISNSSIIDLSDYYGKMKPEVLRAGRMRTTAGFRTFERHIKTNIDKGVPLLWSVMLGIVPENGKNLPHGGHMRLIIGYNDKTQEILYSDSWGRGNELKRMPQADAWAITTNMATVEPF